MTTTILATEVETDPFGGTPANQSPAGCAWPPEDAAELERLDRWADECEREHAERGDE